MKKSIAIIILCLTCTCVFALGLPSKVLGYGFSLSGSSKGSLDVSFSFRHTVVQLPFLVPSLNYSITLGSTPESIGFKGAKAMASITLLRTINHPFRFVAINPTALAPDISFGIDYRLKGDCYWISELSLFKFEEKDFIYEWMSPYICFSSSFKEIDEWGVTLLRFTCLF